MLQVVFIVVILSSLGAALLFRFLNKPFYLNFDQIYCKLFLMKILKITTTPRHELVITRKKTTASQTPIVVDCTHHSQSDK